MNSPGTLRTSRSASNTLARDSYKPKIRRTVSPHAAPPPLAAAVNIENLALNEARALILSRMQAYATENGRLRALELFRQFDTTSNGSINEAEFRSMLKTIQVRGTSTELVKAIMKSIDKDNKGEIEYKRFTESMLSVDYSQARRAEALAVQCEHLDCKKIETQLRAKLHEVEAEASRRMADFERTVKAMMERDSDLENAIQEMDQEMQQASLSWAWRTWEVVVDSKRAANFATRDRRRKLLRWAGVSFSRQHSKCAFNKWRDTTTTRNRGILRRTVLRLLRSKLAAAWRAWVSWRMHVDSRITDGQLNQLKMERFFSILQQKWAALAFRDLARSFRTWKEVSHNF